MAKAIKFTKEETEEVNQLRQDVANLFTKLGQLQIEKKRRIEEIEVVEQDLHNQHSALVEKEQNMFYRKKETWEREERLQLRSELQQLKIWHSS